MASYDCIVSLRSKQTQQLFVSWYQPVPSLSLHPFACKCMFTITGRTAISLPLITVSFAFGPPLFSPGVLFCCLWFLLLFLYSRKNNCQCQCDYVKQLSSNLIGIKGDCWKVPHLVFLSEEWLLLFKNRQMCVSVLFAFADRERKKGLRAAKKATLSCLFSIFFLLFRLQLTFTIWSIVFLLLLMHIFFPSLTSKWMHVCDQKRGKKVVVVDTHTPLTILIRLADNTLKNCSDSWLVSCLVG